METARWTRVAVRGAVAALACTLLLPAAAQTPEQQVVNDAATALGGRDRVMALSEQVPNFDLPSDYSGVVFTPYDAAQHWRFDLVKELNAAGYSVDANKLLI